jgi:hypothetical protein
MESAAEYLSEESSQRFVMCFCCNIFGHVPVTKAPLRLQTDRPPIV